MLKFFVKIKQPAKSRKMLSTSYIKQVVAFAIEEDVGPLDITANLLPPSEGIASIITRESAILCGCDFVDELYRQLDPDIQIHWQAQDSQAVSPDQLLCELWGNCKSLLTGERIALNFLQTLSGTATTTRKFVDLLKGTGITLLDTRKTIPGLRAAQKYAVACGGGSNHRMGLFDAFLIKENHIVACGSIEKAISNAREQQPGKIIEVEVENLTQLKEALTYQADVIMLDNFGLDDIKEAVTINAGRAKLEVSGNITKERISQIAAIGVDYISMGALTKHLRAIDLSMLLKY